MLIPRFKPHFNHKELIAALTPSKGNIEKFEKEFAGKFECEYGVMFQHGRSALYALLKIWNLEDAEVICPAYTCVVVPNAIVLSGNIPVFVDCEKGSVNMSYDCVNDAITSKTRAIVVTHLFGYPMDVYKIETIVNEAEKKYKHKIYIIQDVAHSFGAKWKGELVTKFGDAALFGLNISKIITSIFGGMIITHSEEIYMKLISYRNKNLKKGGIIKTLKRFIYLISTYFAFNRYLYACTNWLERNEFLGKLVKYYDEFTIYFPSDWDLLPSEIEARVGLMQLSKYDEIISTRVQNAKSHIEKLKHNNQIQLFPHIEGSTYSHFVGLVDNRNNWLNEYRKKGIQLGKLIEYSVPEMKVYIKYKQREYPVAKYYAEHTVNFPVW
ncbi:MAG: DegT/DnrJ/EryC1/StrS family aminotransferase [Bacteroidota bacterium]